MKLADRVEVLQVEALCRCGARATHNARTIGGTMVVEGAQVVVGDVNQSADDVGYEVLCRRHHRRRMTAATARAAALSPDVLPVSSTSRPEESPDRPVEPADHREHRAFGIRDGGRTADGRDVP